MFNSQNVFYNVCGILNTPHYYYIILRHIIVTPDGFKITRFWKSIRTLNCTCQAPAIVKAYFSLWPNKY